MFSHQMIPTNSFGETTYISTGNVEEVSLEYASELQDLTFNSKPHINNLTIIAGENIFAAPQICALIENRIRTVDLELKLPALYLMDSICKNIGGIYCNLFAQNIQSIFCDVYMLANMQMRNSLQHLLKTWHGIFPEDSVQTMQTFIVNCHKITTVPNFVTPRFLVQQPQPQHQPVLQQQHFTQQSLDKLGQQDRLEEILEGQKRMRVSQDMISSQPQRALKSPQSFQPEQPPMSHRANYALQTQQLPLSVASPLHPTLNTALPTMTLENGVNNNIPFSRDALLQVQLLIQQQINQLHTIISSRTLAGATLQDPQIVDALQNVRQLQAVFQYTQSLLNQISVSTYPSMVSSSSTVVTPNIHPNVHSDLSNGIGQQQQPSPPPQEVMGLLRLLQSIYPSSTATAHLQQLVKSTNTTTESVPPIHSKANHVILPAPELSSGTHLNAPKQYSASLSTSSANNSKIVSANLTVPSSQESHLVKKEHPWSAEALKSRIPANVESLYSAFPLQCQNCGLRFIDRVKMNKHLDWHFQQNRKEKTRVKKAISRSWYLTKEEWILDTDSFDTIVSPLLFGESTDTSEENTQNKIQSIVAADERQSTCPICGEKFEQFFDSDQDEWMYRDAMCENGIIYHQPCFENSSALPPLIMGERDVLSSPESPLSPSREQEEQREQELPKSPLIPSIVGDIPTIPATTTPVTTIAAEDERDSFKRDSSSTATKINCVTVVDSAQSTKKTSSSNSVPSINDECEIKLPEECFEEIPPLEDHEPAHNVEVMNASGENHSENYVVEMNSSSMRIDKKRSIADVNKYESSDKTTNEDKEAIAEKTIKDNGNRTQSEEAAHEINTGTISTPNNEDSSINNSLPISDVISDQSQLINASIKRVKLV